MTFQERTEEFRQCIREAAELLNFEIWYGSWIDNPNGPIEWEGLAVYDKENEKAKKEDIEW